MSRTNKACLVQTPKRYTPFCMPRTDAQIMLHPDACLVQTLYRMPRANTLVLHPNACLVQTLHALYKHPDDTRLFTPRTNTLMHTLYN